MEPAAASADAAGAGGRGIVARPRLFGKLASSGRVTVVSAPPGSGKTVLLRSWSGRPGLVGSVAWMPVGRGERDSQRFWLSVLDALRQTAAGSVLVQAVTAAPDLDGWAIVERLLTDLAPLADPVWLVIDDLHEMGADQALRQLELLIMRAPRQLRFVLATRPDVRLGLHRLRLEGDLVEIRGPDLRFTLDEARELFEAAGVHLPGLALLVERTEGWAAGLRLAALSLAGHADPERFAEEFSGSERTVAEYLLAEVLDRQPEPVRRLLLRTCILESVNGELADLLTGGSGGEQVLQDLERANAFNRGHIAGGPEGLPARGRSRLPADLPGRRLVRCRLLPRRRVHPRSPAARQAQPESAGRGRARPRDRVKGGASKEQAGALAAPEAGALSHRINALLGG